jgi:putative Mg2+ transporter-C (MgtC) family protein
MTTLWTAISDDLDTLRIGVEFWQAVFRILVAAILGAGIGYQRERTHQAAGLRTYMLVTIGSALLVLTIRHAGGGSADISRVMQGVVTGIGFIGAGAIIKRDKEHEVRGLTTAAGVWLATAIGMAAGLGRLELAVPGAIVALIVLAALRKLEKHTGLSSGDPGEGK